MYQDRDLLDILCDINFRMTHYGGKAECNILERYSYFANHAEKKKHCSYALKYRDMFITHDYDTISTLILEAADMIRSLSPNVAPTLSSPSHGDEEDAN